jgi:predicted nucleic acid-binding Zn ribbon protein
MHTRAAFAAGAGKEASGRTVVRPSRQREGKICHVSEAVEALFARLGRPRQGRLNMLWRQWDELMGEDLALLGRPLGQKDGVLRIGADDAAALQELALRGEEILEKANAFMQEDVFREVSARLARGRTDLSGL